MVEADELNEGDEVMITGRPAQGDSQVAVVMDAGEIMLRTPSATPRSRGTIHSDVALVSIEDGRYAVVQLENVET